MSASYLRHLWLLLGPVAAACVQAHDVSTPSPASPRIALSSQGLYADIQKEKVAPEVFEYSPTYALWSDAADKRRWLLLPAFAVVDTNDMDHWDFPVGTRVFKEFSLDGIKLETRMIERVAATGRLRDDFVFSTFIWRSDQEEALLEKNGRNNVLGTEHDVPAQKLCSVCHRGEASTILGFSALQLSGSGDLARAEQAGLLSHPPDREFDVPGDRVAQRALGTLHANCGHCHTAGGVADFMTLQIVPSEVDGEVEDLAVYRSLVDQPLSDEWEDPPAGFSQRIAAGFPQQSAVLYRMRTRGRDDEADPDQMPPLATTLVDWEAVHAVAAWITELPH